MENGQRQIVTNSDNSAAMPMCGSGFVVGYVDEVNGPGSKEVSDFQPTRGELLQLARYWYREALDIEYFWFYYAQTSSSESRLKAFAYRRIDRIANLLGEETINEVIEAVRNEFAKTTDPRAWDIFCNGTPEQVLAFQEEVQESIKSSETNQEHE